MGGFNETQHRRNPDGTFADMGNTRLKAACGTANARPDFSGIDLRERNFSFHDLSAADLHDADLRACEFWHTNLRGADLSGSDMRGAGLYSSDLSQADLSDVELRNATLANCDFHDADVSSTHWDAAAIVDCDFRGTGLTPDDVLDHMEERDTTYAFARNLFDDGSGYAAEVDYDSEAAYSSATLYAPGYDPEDHDGPLRFLTVSDARGAFRQTGFLQQGGHRGSGGGVFGQRHGGVVRRDAAKDRGHARRVCGLRYRQVAQHEHPRESGHDRRR